MPLTTDEKLLALSRETIEVFDKANGGVQTGAREGYSVDRHVHAFVGSGFADAGAASAPGFHAGDGPLLGLCGNSGRCR